MSKKLIVPGLEDMDMTGGSITYTFEPGIPLPDVGSSFDQDDFTVVIIAKNEETRQVDAVIKSKPGAVLRYVEQAKKNLEDSLSQMAELFFYRTKTGMTSFLSWADLPEDEQIKYLDLAYDTVKLLNEKGVIKYDIDLV